MHPAIGALVVIFATACAAAPGINASTYAAIRSDVQRGLGLTPSYGRPCLDCPDGHIVGGIVRLAFHDAVGAAGPNRRFGPNGCLDLTTSANNGLADIIALLDNIQASSQYGALLSRADFWVLAATLVLELTSTLAADFEPDLFDPAATPNPMDLNAMPLKVPFYTGRIDQPSCPGDGNLLPGANFNWGQIQELFTGRVGMTSSEIIAILGGHSLGGLEAADVNGNLTGSWVQSGGFRRDGGSDWGSMGLTLLCLAASRSLQRRASRTTTTRSCIEGSQAGLACGA